MRALYNALYHARILNLYVHRLSKVQGIIRKVQHKRLKCWSRSSKWGKLEMGEDLFSHQVQPHANTGLVQQMLGWCNKCWTPFYIFVQYGSKCALQRVIHHLSWEIILQTRRPHCQEISLATQDNSRDHSKYLSVVEVHIFMSLSY